MVYKILFLIVPLSIASISNFTRPKGDQSRKISTPLIIKDSDYLQDSVPLITVSSSNYTGDDYFKCDRYGPFPANDASNFTISLTYELHSISNQSVIERIRFFTNSNSLLSTSNKAAILYTKGMRRTISFNVPMRDYWSSNGLTLKFEIVNSSTRAILKQYSASIYPPSNSYIKGEKLKREKYVSKKIAFYGDGSDLKEIQEEYDFTSFGDYLNIDYYYRLDVNKNLFYFNNDYALTYSSINLRFNDDEGIFPFLNHDNNGDIVVPLSLIRSGHAYTFKYARTFYINKRTLQISDTYRNGFILTNDFYLPINGMRKFNGKIINFEFNKMGLDGISTSIPVHYDTVHSLVGVCKDGDYCVVGGRR